MKFFPVRSFRKTRTWLVIFLGIAMFAGTGCSDEAELTPEQKTLFATWDISKEIRKDFRDKKTEELISRLSPEFEGKDAAKKNLEALFLGLEKTTMHLNMDSGVWIPQTRTIEYKAHWTFSGFVKEGSPRIFKTGECRIWIRLGDSEKPPLIEKITGDNFLLVGLPKQTNGTAGEP